MDPLQGRAINSSRLSTFFDRAKSAFEVSCGSLASFLVPARRLSAYPPTEMADIPQLVLGAARGGHRRYPSCAPTTLSELFVGRGGNDPSFKMQGREGIVAMVPRLSRRGAQRNRPMRVVESGVRPSDVVSDRSVSWTGRNRNGRSNRNARDKQRHMGDNNAT